MLALGFGNPQQTLKGHLAAKVFTKWIFLFIILAGFGQTLWYWTMKHSSKNTVGLGDVVSEGQLAELEEFLKKMMKMLQFQLELVDMKFGKEVEGMKKEFLLWARVVHHSEGYFCGNGRKWGLAAVGSLFKTGNPMHPHVGKVLEPSFGEPG